MGIYIKGMEMPTGERPVHIEIHRDGTVLQWKFNESDEIIGTAVEVPQHGRLIDADNFIDRVKADVGMVEEDLSFEFKDGIWTVLKLLETQPTVSESEK